jgi:3'-5' exonuclease
MIATMPVENFLIIDIETVSEKKNFETLDEDWQQLWQEKVSKIVPENFTVAEFYPQRAAVMAEFAKIVCISIGYFNKQQQLQFRVKSIASHDEKEILNQFIATINQLELINNKWCFTGHNIKEFDIPFICRRLLIQGLPIPSYLDFQNMKPWQTNIIDTFQFWRFGDFKNYTSLKLLAASLQVPSPKDDIDGSMVGKVYWQDGDLERIALYCQKDVATVANIILKFKNQPLLQPAQIVFVK